MLAIAVATAVLNDVFAGAVRKLGLHLHEPMRVCHSYKCASPKYAAEDGVV